MVIQVPSQFFSDWLEKHFFSLIQTSIKQVTKSNLSFSFSVHPDGEGQRVAVTERSADYYSNRLDHTNYEDQLNPRYVFDTFVVGNSNQFAHAASLAVAEAPSKTKFNPLVVYGGVGLGKTHLIQAIGNHVRNKDLSKRLVYVSSEKFTIEFINSIQNNKMAEFSNYYRNVDILLVDDIHFFMEKERTQEEFFHTFNALHHHGKQIVLTSDRPPKELKGLEERLISRFQWGLVADIQPPDLETRIAILQKKAEDDGLSIPGDVIAFIAANVSTNIRELEGSLIRLLAFSSLTNTDITVDSAKEVLKDTIQTDRKQISIESIQEAVSKHLHIPEDMLRAKTRKKEVVVARHVAMYLSKHLTNSSLKTIGLHFGGRDHSTVIHACQIVEEKMKESLEFKNLIEKLSRAIAV